ncbi:hypothetical protein V565_307020, partial [Rhizoctonia solani 123E]
ETSPSTPTSAPHHSDSLAIDEQGGDAGTGLPGTSPQYEIATDGSDEPQPDITKVDNGFDQSAGSNRATAADRAAGTAIGSRVFNSDTATSTVPGPSELPTSEVGLTTTVPDQVDPDNTGITESQKPEHTPLIVPDAPSAKWKGLKQFARVLEPVSNLFGPIKETMDLFTECVDKCEATKVEYEELRVRLEGIFEDLKGYFGKENSLTMTSSMENLCRSIQAELNYIKKQQDRNIGKRYLSAADESDKVLACYRRIERHLQRLS